MPSAIGGLTPEYRGADIRCGLNERLGCGQSRLMQMQLVLTRHLLAFAVLISLGRATAVDALLRLRRE